MGCSAWCCESYKTQSINISTIILLTDFVSFFLIPSLLFLLYQFLLSCLFLPFYLPIFLLIFSLILRLCSLISLALISPHFSPSLPPFYFFTSSVRRLSAAASGEDFAQHGDGESRRRLDGSGRVPGQKWSMQRWVMFTLCLTHTHMHTQIITQHLLSPPLSHFLSVTCIYLSLTDNELLWL